MIRADPVPLRLTSSFDKGIAHSQTARQWYFLGFVEYSQTPVRDVVGYPDIGPGDIQTNRATIIRPVKPGWAEISEGPSFPPRALTFLRESQVHSAALWTSSGGLRRLETLHFFEQLPRVIEFLHCSSLPVSGPSW